MELQMAVAMGSIQPRRIFEPATSQLPNTTPQRAASTAEASEIHTLEPSHMCVGGELR
jgi:hypothetical protein